AATSSPGRRGDRAPRGAPAVGAPVAAPDHAPCGARPRTPTGAAASRGRAGAVRDALRDGRLRIREVAAVVVDDAVRGALGGPAALALAAVLRVGGAADLGGVLTRVAAAADREHAHETDHHRKKNVLHRRTLCLRRRPSCAVETSLRVRSPAGPGGPRQRA